MIELQRFLQLHSGRIARALNALPWVIRGLLAVALINAGVEWFQAHRFTQSYLALTGNPGGNTPVSEAQREEMVKRMTGNRWIARPMQLTGVLGDSAIFDGGMMVKAGESAGDMKVISVGANSVKVTKDGQEQTLYVFQPPPGGGAGGGPRRTGTPLPRK